MNQDWLNIFDDELFSLYNDALYELKLLEDRNKKYTPESIFRAFELTKPGDIRVVIIGQDPYPMRDGVHIADGLAFSSANVQPSLRNIEAALLKSKLINGPFSTGRLDKWARQGVLLMNRDLTYCRGEKNTFWSPFTTCLLNKVCQTDTNIYVCMWGNKAKEMGNYIRAGNNIKRLSWIHPSPLNNMNTRIKNENRFENCNHFKIISREYNIDWNL